MPSGTRSESDGVAYLFVVVAIKPPITALLTSADKV